MNVALILTAYAAVLGALGPWALRRAAWLDRAPRLAILAWQSLAVAVVGAATLAGLTLVVPASAFGADLAAFLNACVLMLRAAYATPHGALAVTAGLAVSATIVVRALYGVAAELAAARRERCRHLAVLDMVAHRDADLGALVLEHSAATAYCLPGRGGRIVLTTSALAALDERRLAAVLAHERAHLRGRHHLLVAIARGLKRAFPVIPLFAVAAEEISRLTELVADDAAVKRAGRLTVADALLTLADDRMTPAAALAASGRHTGRRVRRLLGGSRPLKAAVVVPASIFALGMMTAPVAVAAAPAVAAAGQNYCVVIT
ncbi:M56 family metallopeptidase [Nonomuraea sp. M3C6]|uniref:M56 family metallopeptidase n=1 Tax=Nonomuraea marmarensis TaxID=3351344 RepID=A0ABW7AMR5_9ACTN